MNKTVTINISGIIFHIEEDAYEKLSKYLNTIKGYFSNTDGGSEIMSDIEARIAEMLQGKTSAVKQVVLMADVDSVINAMGKPEEFAEGHEQNEQKQESSNYTTGEQIKKRLYRDPDRKAIGGVCSGIAAYFDMDVVWIRLLMFLLIFFGGVSLWVYFILWIVIPEAKTTAEKLAMHGEKIDINNISKAVKDEAEQLKRRAEKYGSDSRNGLEKIVDFLKDIAIIFGKLFVRIVGLALLIFGVIFLIVIMSSIFGFSIAGTSSNYNDWINMIFVDHMHYTMGAIGLILFFGVPVIMMLYGGIKLLFKIHYSNRWLNISAGLIWLVGFIIVLFISVKTGKDFSETGRIKQEITIDTPKDTLYLTLNKNKELLASLYDLDDGDEVRIRHNNDNYMIAKNDKEKFLVGKASLNILPSPTDKFEMYIVKKARGEDKRTALDRAKTIEYKITQNDSIISFDELFTVGNNEKFRAQDVQIIIKVPRNGVIHLDKSLEDFIFDVENVTNTYDGDMVGRRWIMTAEGLACVDCNGIEKNDSKIDLTIPAIPETPGDINVDVKDAKVKIDKDGIKVNAKDADVNIDKNGIHVKQKNEPK